MMLLKQFIH